MFIFYKVYIGVYSGFAEFRYLQKIIIFAFWEDGYERKDRAV